MEVPKELLDKVYEAIELARATGKIEKGCNEVTKTIETGKAQLVIASSDANPKEIILHLPVLSKEKNVIYLEVSSKTELGAAAGIDVGTIAVSIVEAGEAKNIIEEIKTSLSQM